MAMDEHTAVPVSFAVGARILVKSGEQALPGLLQVVAGSSSFSVQLW